MKKSYFIALLVCLASLGAKASVPTLETDKELIAAADVDGDGRQDVVIANKRGGSLRAAFGAAGGYTHLGPVTVAPYLQEGADVITGLSLARFSGANPNAAVLASPGGGQLKVITLDKSSPSTFGRPLVSPLTIQSIGPSELVALPIGVAGANPSLDGIVLGSSLNGSPSPGVVENLKITAASTLASHSAGNLTNSLLVRNANPVPYNRSLLTGPFAGLIVGTPYDAPLLQIYNVSAAAANPASPAISQQLAQQGYDHFVTGFFGAALSPQVLVYAAGAPMIYAYPLTPGTPPTLGAPYFRNFAGSAIATISVVRGQGAASDRLLITFSSGAVRAGLYSYDGVNFPTLVQSYSVPPSGDFAGGIGMDNGEFLLFEKDPLTGGSKGFSRYSFNGALIDSAGFPPKLPLSGRGNVIFYSDTPLANPAARVISVLNSGDWAGSTPSTSPLPSPVTASSEVFQSEAAGLGSASIVSLGAPPAGALGVLGNQFAGDISTYNLGGAVGTVADSVSIDPPAGAFQSAITIEIASSVNTASPNTNDIYFRVDTGLQQGSWQLYNPNTPPQLAYDAAVLAYSIPKAGGARSNIARAQYTFKNSGTLDSDADGIPDHVELGAGTDPAAGVDSDGDGDSDLTELYAGTDPNDPGSNLGRLANQEHVGGIDSALASFDLSVHVTTRRSYLGAGVDAIPASGVTVSAQTVEGGILSTGKTTVQGAVSTARLEGITPDAAVSYFTVSTPLNFALEGLSGNGGREVLALVQSPVPAHSLPSDYFNGSDSTATAKANWVSALRTEFLPTSGYFYFTCGNATSGQIPYDATPAQIKASLDAMNSNTGVFGAGICGVSGQMPRYSVLALAPKERSASEISASSYLSPYCKVLVVPKKDSTAGSLFVQFDILVMPAPRIISANATVTDTLLALLVEKKLGSLLGISKPTLFPRRAGDAGRTPVTPDLITQLEAGAVEGSPGAPACLLEGIIEPIRAALLSDKPSAGILALLQVANYIYEFSSEQTGPGPTPSQDVINSFRTGNLTAADTPAAMPAPVDALRQFLADGSISATYTGQPSLTVRSNASSGVAACLAATQTRPVFVGTLKVSSGTMLVLDGVFNGLTYQLYDSSGKAYPFDASVPLQPGTRLAVTAFNDLDAGGNPHLVPLEAISVSLLSLPETKGEDSDANLLADDWEEAFYGSIGQSAYSTGAGGKSLVQLYLDGNDPTLGSASAAADLFPRQVRLQQEMDGAFTMGWKFPSAYAAHFAYTLQTTASLQSPFADALPAGALSISGDDHALPLGPAASPKMQFWRLKLKLNR
jgi:hypothetical protein